MYQKCPICNGMGNMPTVLASSTMSPCEVYKGYKIISQINGLPPTHRINNEEEDLSKRKLYLQQGNTVVRDDTKKDFRDNNMETQQEYFGK